MPMYYQEIAPSAVLSPFIKCFWILENEKQDSVAGLQKVLPDACPELIIHYGDRFRIRSEGKIRRQPYAFLFGPITRYIEIGPSGTTGMIAARFYPGALSAFLSFPVKGIADRYVALDKVFGKEATALERSVRADGKDHQQMIAVLETFLVARLLQNGFVPVLKRSTLEQITGRQVVKIEALSEQLHIGRRHLERKFNEQVGMTPRLFLRIVRFQNVFRIIHRKSVRNLTDLTYRAGYFDQSHFHRDFKAFTGMSPKDYFKEDATLTRLFLTS